MPVVNLGKPCTSSAILDIMSRPAWGGVRLRDPRQQAPAGRLRGPGRSDEPRFFQTPPPSLKKKGTSTRLWCRGSRPRRFQAAPSGLRIAALPRSQALGSGLVWYKGRRRQGSALNYEQDRSHCRRAGCHDRSWRTPPFPVGGELRRDQLGQPSLSTSGRPHVSSTCRCTSSCTIMRRYSVEASMWNRMWRARSPSRSCQLTVDAPFPRGSS